MNILYQIRKIGRSSGTPKQRYENNKEKIDEIIETFVTTLYTEIFYEKSDKVQIVNKKTTNAYILSNTIKKLIYGLFL